MNRTGGWTALGIAIAAGIVFGFFPELDIAMARWFSLAGGFPLQSDPILTFVRDASMWIVALLIAPTIIAAVLKVVFPQSRMLVRGRAFVFLVTTMVLGPMVLTNVVLKDQYGRPRPHAVVEFGGSAQFMPWWDPRGACAKNCSFVAGEASGAAWTFAPAALAPPTWRPFAYAGAVAFTAAVGIKRMAFGGHFASDVVFAGVFTFFVVWFVHGFLYRWRSRISDETVEGALASIGAWLRRRWAGAQTPPAAPSPLPASAADLSLVRAEEPNAEIGR